jgi:hypothetical protein
MLEAIMQQRSGSTRAYFAKDTKIQTKAVTALAAVLLSTAAIMSVAGTAQAQDIGGFLGGAVGNAIGSAIRGGAYHSYPGYGQYQYKGERKRKHHKDDNDEEASRGSSGSSGSNDSKAGSEKAGASQDSFGGRPSEYHSAAAPDDNVQLVRDKAR